MTALIPVNFGRPARALVGVYQPAGPAGNQGACALLCNPFGQEAIRSHRMFRVLSDRLARNGVAVLRFDYYGTGDSGGDDQEGDFEGWIDDVLEAHAELVRRSSGARPSWFGLRLGGSLAALASARLKGHPPHLVLWDPIVDGAAHLSDLAHAHVESAKASWGPRWVIEETLRDKAKVEAETEALGFPLTESLKRQLRDLTASSFRPIQATRITHFKSRPADKPDEFERIIAAPGRAIEVKTVRAEIDWMTNEAMNSAIAPFEDIQNVTAAISAS